MVTAAVSAGGKARGRYVGTCTFATTTEIVRSLALKVYGQGQIDFAGELSAPVADAVFPATGGAGRYALARGYRTNHRTATGASADQVLHRYWT